jgi:hypothetical protein
MIAIFVSIAPALAAIALPQAPVPPVEVDRTIPPLEEVLRAAPEAARNAWTGMNAACRTEETADLAITAFSLRADVITRNGVQTNQMKVDYRFLAPHFIRFLLPSGRETGRGPGEGQRGYWLQERGEVIPLIGRESREDRRLVDEMVVVARNFIALSDPARVRLTRLESLPTPPTDLPHPLQRLAAKLEWIRAASPDFALVSEQVDRSDTGTSSYLVDLGLDRKTGLPTLALIREERAGPSLDLPPTSRPMLIHLPAWRLLSGFQVPWLIRVHHLDPTGPRRSFAESPAQEIELRDANLRPDLKPEDFLPG